MRSLLFREAELKYPLNIYQLCEMFDDVEIVSMPFKTKGLRGVVCAAKDNNENNVIIVNSNKSAEEQNYNGMHELVHLITHNIAKGMSLSCFEKSMPHQDPYIEWLANEGAAEFLVPYKILLPMIKSNYQSMNVGTGTYYFCKDKAKSFGVSLVVMQNRLNSLAYEIEQYLNGCELEKIEILSFSEQKKTWLEHRIS